MNKFFSYIRHQYIFISKVLLFILAVVIINFFLPKEGKFKYEYMKGKPWMHESLIAPFDFAILKTDDELKKERGNIIRELPPYFIYNEKVPEEKREALPGVFEVEWQKLSRRRQKDKEQQLRIATQLLDTVLSRGIIKFSPLLENQPVSYPVILVRDNIAEQKRLDDFFTIRSASEYISASLEKMRNADRELLMNVLQSLIVQNVEYDEKHTEAEAARAIQQISLTRGMVQQGERIISKGDLVTGDRYQVLESLKKEYTSRLGASSSYILILLGQIVLVSIAILSLFLYIFFFRKDIFGETRKLILILLVMVLMVLATSLVVRYYPGFLYLVPICLAPILIRAFFDSRFALIIHLFMVIIIGFIVPNSFEFSFLQLITGIVTIISVVNLQRRAQFFLSSLLIFLSYSIIYTGLSLIHEGSFNQIQYLNYAFFAGSAVLTLFAFPVIYILEKVFGYITHVTLMELSDTNRKLLRQLSRVAPGTFQHSLQVANLAEEVIFEIGGDALLVRTGALYHDIGKTDMPLYFIENQVSGVNPHDDLTYEESARIIVSHVIRGIEKAKKYQLPEQLIDFIRTHHGTKKAGYFYAKQLKDFPDETIDEDSFTYPGPTPFSKETAVLMMADSVEAASRSLDKPDEEKIDNMVENIINSQVEEGQLANADLTLKEITRIKKILKRRLMNIYHLRIEYPE